MRSDLGEPVVWSAITARSRGLGGQSASVPVLTAYWDGARTELSALTLANAVAKAGNALIDEADIEPGDLVALDLPWHWQRCVWALACWSAGATLQPTQRGSELNGAATEGVRLNIVGEDRIPENVAALTIPTWAVSLHPLGLPVANLPRGVEDAALLARAAPDDFLPPAQVGSALQGISQDQALDIVQHAIDARHPATSSRIRRLLIPGPLVPGPPVEEHLDWLLPALGPILPEIGIVITQPMSAQQAQQVAGQEGAELW